MAEAASLTQDGNREDALIAARMYKTLADIPAVRQSHGHGGDVGQGLVHARRDQGVLAVAVLGQARGLGHPVQVRPGAEAGPGSGQEHHPHVVGAVEGLEGLGQGLDGQGVQGVALARTIDCHRRHTPRG